MGYLGTSCIAVQVLLALSRLVNALGMESPTSYSLLIPILQTCTATNQVKPVYRQLQTLRLKPMFACTLLSRQCHADGLYRKGNQHCSLPVRATSNAKYCTCLQPDQLNLLEDGLQLWLVALRNAPLPDPGLLSLFPNLAAVMQQSTGSCPLSSITSASKTNACQ